MTQAMKQVNQMITGSDKEESSKLPEGERYFGFVNDSNICYANSAIQVLYHCQRFRRAVLAYKVPKTPKDSLVGELQELFESMDS